MSDNRKLVVVVLLTGGTPESSDRWRRESPVQVYRNLSQQNFFATTHAITPSGSGVRLFIPGLSRTTALLLGRMVEHTFRHRGL